MTPHDLPDGDHWLARTVQPVTAIYLTAVLGAFMVVAGFVFHSKEAVLALAALAGGELVMLAPSFLNRVEYLLTESGLQKRHHRPKDPPPFKEVFTWDELSHLTPTGAGFKFTKKFSETGALKRFYKLHVSGDYSGEFHVEPADRKRIEGLFRARGIPTTKDAARRLGAGSPEA